ncbi:MAG: peroxiredoxin [Defluviicoccus sp.]|nr:peroxiredoxin [Defluviicoccus sp.]
MSLAAGQAAPEFSGVTADGTPVRLTDFRGRKLVLYFYPMDDTPGCTRQACSLRDHNAEIAAKGAAILGVSAQSRESHQRFTEKYRLNFPLLVDTDQKVAKAYEAAGSGIVGAIARGMLGMNRRITYVIDEQGMIAHVVDDPDTAGHGEQVLRFL